jgi:hypothetical protein
VLLAPRDALFHVVTAQWTRAERVGGVSASFLASLKTKAGVYLDLAWDAPVLVFLSVMVIAGLAVSWWRGWRPDFERPMGDARSAQLTCVGIGFLSFVPHLALSQAFLTYLIPLWALLTPAAAIGLVCGLGRSSRHREFATGAAVLLLALAAANAVAKRDIWIGSGDQSFSKFQGLADELGKLGGPDCTILTFQTNLAVEAGCDLLPGLEYSFFSYFVGTPSDEAEEMGVISGALLRKRVAALRPELIAIAPENLRVLHGEAARAGLFSPRRAGGTAPIGERPLDFLGNAGTPYEFRGSYEISNGIRRPGARGSMPLLVFTRGRHR